MFSPGFLFYLMDIWNKSKNKFSKRSIWRRQIKCLAVAVWWVSEAPGVGRQQRWEERRALQADLPPEQRVPTVRLCVHESVCVCFVREARLAHGECINAPAPLVIPSFSLSLTVTQHLPYPSSYPPPAPPYSPSPPPPTVLSCFMGHTWYTQTHRKKMTRNGRGEAEINALISNRIPVFGLKVPWDWMKIKTQKQNPPPCPPKKFIIECTCVLKGKYLGEEKKKNPASTCFLWHSFANGWVCGIY